MPWASPKKCCAFKAKGNGTASSLGNTVSLAEADCSQLQTVGTALLPEGPSLQAGI